MRVCVALFVVSLSVLAQHPAVDRALLYLSAEVARWPKENQCFSCHNNGDAARALLIAKNKGRVVKIDPGTVKWLANPSQWADGAPNPIFDDEILSSIQFAAALNEDRSDKIALQAAAQKLTTIQSSDGAWHIDEGESVGSPVTYGTALATAVAHDVLLSADPKQFAPSIGRASAFLDNLRPTNVPEAAAIAMINGPSEKAIDFFEKSQNPDGGWGPWKLTPSETFDTALATMAVCGKSPAAVRGREYLVRTQLPNGGWTETTRPTGGHSYAQHVSTTAWATIALLRCDPERK